MWESSQQKLLAASLLFTLVSLLDLVLCPHSKVEESFQLQATHDLFYHGLGPAWGTLFGDGAALPYDHLRFPGVVPRTFLGPLLLSSFCHIIRFICLPVVDIAAKPMLVQFLARAFLLGINTFGWMRLAAAAENRLGNTKRNIGSWLLIITACQFHIPFYASRMLPNTFALAIILHAYSFWLNKQIEGSAICLVFAAAIFRCDILLLLASIGVSWLILGQLTILRAFRLGVVTGIVSLLLTVPIDSLLWQRILWPEGEVLYYNTILGKSSNWGTSPWHWYFTSAIPKSMLFTLLLVPLSVLRLPEVMSAWGYRTRQSTWTRSSTIQHQWIDTDTMPYLIPILGFIILYSHLGHKEMRFIFPAVPILNLAAASSLARISQLASSFKEKKPSVIGRLSFLFGILCLVATMAGNMIFVSVSRWNYPGGEALVRLSHHVGDKVVNPRSVYVHIDVASAMSGVSLFGQRAAETQAPQALWTFDKGGYEEENALDVSKQFTHVLTESVEGFSGFAVVDTVMGTPRLNLRQLRVETTPSILVLENEEFSN